MRQSTAGSRNKYTYSILPFESSISVYSRMKLIYLPTMLSIRLRFLELP